MSERKTPLPPRAQVPFALVMESIHELESARTAAATATATERSPRGLSDSQRTAPVPDGNDLIRVDILKKEENG